MKTARSVRTLLLALVAAVGLVGAAAAVPYRPWSSPAAREAALAAIRDYGGDVVFDDAGRVRRVNLVYHEAMDEGGDFPPLP